MIINTNFPRFFSFKKLIARESSSKELLSSDYIRVTLKVHDLNDNSPKFSHEIYYSTIDAISTINENTELTKFEVNDKDLGIYGVPGLECFLTGDEADKWIDILYYRHLFEFFYLW